MISDAVRMELGKPCVAPVKWASIHDTTAMDFLSVPRARGRVSKFFTAKADATLEWLSSSAE